MSKSFKKFYLVWEDDMFWKYICLKKKKKTNSLESEETVQISPYLNFGVVFMSQDLSLANIKNFQTCSLDDLDEI